MTKKEAIKFIKDNYSEMATKKIKEITGWSIGEIRKIAYSNDLKKNPRNTCKIQMKTKLPWNIKSWNPITNSIITQWTGY